MLSMMSRTTARLGVFGFGFVITVCGLLNIVDPEPGTAPRPWLAGVLMLAGVASMVKSFGMMREERPKKRVERHASAKRARVP